jgi:outer membrane biogenesis lipoprotein LolB
MGMIRLQKPVVCLLGLLCLMIQSCSTIYKNSISRLPDLASQEESLSIIESIREKNNSLRTFKGLGKIELNNKKDSFITRTAWMGSYPDRFRIELFGIAGQPLISLSADQDQLFFLSHADSNYIHRDDPASALEELLSLPVKVEDAIEFLSGRIPIREHETSRIEKSDPNNGYILILEKNWTGVTEKIYLDEKKTKIYKVEIFGITGALNYRAELLDEILVDGFHLPSYLVLSNENGESFKLHIDRYFANTPVTQSMFTIPPPGVAE